MTIFFSHTARKRQIFDQCGEEGLKRGGGGGPGPGGMPAGFEGGYTFTSDPREIFTQFFGPGVNPFEGMMFGGVDGSDMHSGMGGGPRMTSFSFGGVPGRSSGSGSMDFASMTGGLGSGGFGGGRGMQQDPPVEHPLNLHLEELCTGCTKKMKISRTVVSSGGSRSKEEKIVAVEVKPGWKAGTKVTFAREGDQLPGKIPSDVVFVIGEKPHAKFKREGNDLRHKVDVSLRTALCGGEVNIPYIEGDVVKRKVVGIINPATEERIVGRGMPISKQPGQRGDLLVNYNIRFPTAISDKDKKQLDNILKKYQS